jgi:hypothetical protein
LLYRSYRGVAAINPHHGEGEVPVQASKPKSPSPAQTVEVKVTPEEDEKKERITQGMKLLLAARDRVLTLTEQRARAFREYIEPHAHVIHATDPVPSDTQPNIASYHNVNGSAIHCR